MDSLAISKGIQFETFRAFKKALKQHCKCTRTKFVTFKSEALSKEISDQPYKLKVYKCHHHIDTKCQAWFRLLYKKAGTNAEKYLITRMENKHNHKLDYAADSESSDCESLSSETSTQHKVLDFKSEDHDLTMSPESSAKSQSLTTSSLEDNSNEFAYPDVQSTLEFNTSILANIFDKSNSCMVSDNSDLCSDPFMGFFEVKNQWENL